MRRADIASKLAIDASVQDAAIYCMKMVKLILLRTCHGAEEDFCVIGRLQESEAVACPPWISREVGDFLSLRKFLMRNIESVKLRGCG